MSRIHEALKKAAQERSSRIAPGVTQDYLDVSTGAAGTTVAATDRVLPLTDDSVSELRSSLLSFEELLKNCAHPQWRPDPRISVFLGSAASQTDTECFRTLRSRLFQIAGTRQLKRVLVTSSIPAEGKTFVTVNLAQSIVRQDNCRVLLIDGDLRVSRVHEVLGAPATPGLTEYLRGETNELSIIQKGSEGNLCFIPGGGSVTNPSELLLSARMQHLLELVTPIFDWIVVDSPPVIPVHDASMLADLCDGVLFVVRAGSTHFEIVERASSEFRDKNLLGVVLNRVEKNESYGSYYCTYPVLDKNKS